MLGWAVSIGMQGTGMRIRTMVLALAAGLACDAAGAAQLTVDVSDRQGQPVGDAIVSLIPRQGTGPKHAAAVTHSIDQKELTFLPYVELARPGDAVVFRNSDATRHHVYSFSPVKQFEYVVAPHASSPPVTLPKTGIVAVGCNIHDGMISYLYVSDAPWAQHSDARGRVVFDDLPAGAYTVRVWHPRLPPSKPDLVQDGVTLAATDARRLPFSLVLRPDPRLQFDREHTRY